MDTGKHTPVRISSLTRALNIFFDAWSFLILREQFRGVRRFGALQASLGIPRQTLLRRLETLTNQCVIYKRPIKERRLLFEYRLTPMGLDLHSYAFTIWQWQVRWNREGTVLAKDFIHLRCGQPLELATLCEACSQPLTIDSVAVEPGPGAGFEAPPSQRLGRRRWMYEGGGASAAASARSLLVTCDRWSNLVLDSVFSGVKNFEAIQDRIGIAPNTLHVRLKTLVDLNILHRYPAGSETRMIHYEATEQGRDMFPCLLELSGWADRWLAGWGGPPEIRTHRPCGDILNTRVVCAHCREEIRPGEVRPATSEAISALAFGRGEAIGV